MHTQYCVDGKLYRYCAALDSDDDTLVGRRESDGAYVLLKLRPDGARTVIDGYDMGGVGCCLPSGPHLGDGRFGSVDGAILMTPEGPQRVAVKSSHLYRDTGGEDLQSKRSLKAKRARKKLASEAGLLFALNHPNIVRPLAFDPGRDSGANSQRSATPARLALERAGQCDLSRHLIARKTPPKDAAIRNTVRQIAGALYYLHRSNSAKNGRPSVIHADLKPENVMVEGTLEAGRMRLIDFGTAMAWRGEDRIVRRGSPPYLSPQIWDRQPCGREVDLWALGVILYIMCTRRLPFRIVANDDGTLRRPDGIDSVVAFRKSDTVSNQARDLIRRCLTADKDKRITAAGVLRHPFLSTTR